MGKKIAVINGSPRANGNTEDLADALIAGARRAGHHAEKLNLRSLKLSPCLGCYRCVAGKGNPCAQKDEMNRIYEAVSHADVVVLASPLYWYQFTAQMKVVIDRLFALVMSKSIAQPNKGIALLIVAEDAREENFAHIRSYYKHCLVDILKWKDRGMILAGGVNMPGDVRSTGFLKEAEELGASL